MKWLVIVLVFIPIVCGNKRFEYRNVNADSCDVDDAECVTNQGIEGRCRSTCQVTERVVESDKLCPHSDCKCCTTNTDKCDEIYPGSYCGPPPCDVNMLQIFDTVLCNHNYVCCRPKQLCTFPL
ncbi:uncharacterized protein LOC102809968 [Saccoglossus kowalevskii]|uniref:Uncharacterized protein LOC102809968 n=1 Tax=Saccoglossus kowalevskii TaxID=10224 RepID=A0ABM0N0J7_SACKO|nr:PREDICTED: uncharacterized protein LOC102809968 [Saccoglossus kowalevskii]